MRNVTAKTNGVDTLPDEVFNVNLRKELQDIVTTAGITLDPEAGPDVNQNMLAEAIAKYASASWVYVASGSGDAIVLARAGTLKPVTSYSNPLIIGWFVTSANTGACTVNVAGLGVKDLRYSTGENLPSGYMAVGDFVLATYNGTRFDIIELRSEVARDRTTSAININAIAGQTITMSINGGTAFTVNADGSTTNTGNSVIDGTITASANTDSLHTFGRARLWGVSDHAFLSHFDMVGVADFAIRQDSAGATMVNSATGQELYLAQGGAVKCKVTSSGNFEKGDYDYGGGSNGALIGNGAIYLSQTTTALTSQMAFVNGHGEVGSIRTSGTGTIYATTSDPRLKSSFESLSDVEISELIASISNCVGKFHFLSDSSEEKIVGFNAHSVIDLPLCGDVGTEGNGPRSGKIGEDYDTGEVDKNGDPVIGTVSPAGVDQSKVTPALVLAMDMALKKIEKLELRIAEMEDK